MITIIITFIVISSTITISTITNQSTIICEIETCTNTTIICPAYESCIVDCNGRCINTTINAQSSIHLTINNCNENCCTNLIIDLPIEPQNVGTNLANLNGNGVIKNSIIYTQNGFTDFTMSSSLSMLSTQIFCGITSLNQHSCIASLNGTSCSSSDSSNSPENITCDNFVATITNAIAVTESELSDTASSIPHHHILFGIVICSLLFVGVTLMCVLWIRHEMHFKDIRKAQQKQSNLANPLLFTEAHSNTLSESADTFRTRITHSILKIALTQSVPVNSSDSHSDDVDEDSGSDLYDNSQMEDMARHCMYYTKHTMSGDYDNDGVNLKYAEHEDSEENDLLLSSLEVKKNTLSNSKVYHFNNDIEDDNDQFIVIDNM